MKNLKRIVALCLSLLLLLSFPISAAAADHLDETKYLIEDRVASLTIYKYDQSSIEKDGAWDGSYVSTGVYDEAVNDALADYAIPGVEFSYLKVADIVQFSQAEESDGENVEVLYAVDKVAGADFLAAIDLTDGANRYEAADSLDAAKYYYQSDVLVNALASRLEANSTTVKNALEAYMNANNATAMPLTDEYGKTEAINLDQGLYLLVETGLPQNVVTAMPPALISCPMTAIDDAEGGTRWIYDVALYPKNETGVPTLEKTLRETAADTGDNNDSATDITDGYAHTGTASAGDILDYQIISSLPTITSAATHLSCYSFVDTMSAGLSYVKDDVVLTFFKDAGCTEKIAAWDEDDGKFTVTYNTTAENESVMTIAMTDAGLSEINTANTVYTGADMVNSGYSDCFLRITYQAKLDSDASVVYGDTGNPNEIVLMWQRSSDTTYGTLLDDAHVFTYGIDLTKRFSDGKGNFENVKFYMVNDTDGYFVQASLDAESGIYYVTDHVSSKADATRFTPVTSGGANGKIIIKGLEDDTYTIYEERTDSGYALLKKGIQVVISQAESAAKCDVYSRDVLSLIQNDPAYTQVIQDANDLNNIPQSNAEHKLLTASAAIDGNAVSMKADSSSANALAPLTVVNTKGFNLPETGDNGTVLTTVVGILIMAGAAVVMVAASRKKKSV